MKSRNLFCVLGTGILILSAFNNCEQDVQFNSPSSTGTPEIVRIACDNTPHQTRTVPIHFPKPGYTCEWNINGNLAPRNLYFQARIEQTAVIDLPAGATICDMQFTFPTQKYLYDDHFLMTLNGKVLASSYNFDSVLPKANGLLDYSWTPVAGIYWDTNLEGTFCPSVIGTDGLEHQSTCSWPSTDVAGNISMQFPKEVFYATMANDLNRAQHEFKFISIGDNDSLDCEHSDIQFTVDIEYIQ